MLTPAKIWNTRDHWGDAALNRLIAFIPNQTEKKRLRTQMVFIPPQKLKNISKLLNDLRG